MPGNRQFTSYGFRREVLVGLTTPNLIGPLVLKVPREQRRRLVYFGIIWSGINDWQAEAEMTFHDGSDVPIRLAQKWGTQWVTNGASSTWQGTGQTWRSTMPGFPAYSVDEWGPPANLPNWGHQSAGADAMTIYGVQKPDGTNLQAYRCTMFPWEFIGPLEEIRIQFLNYGPITGFEADPTIEVYLGCKSMTM